MVELFLTHDFILGQINTSTFIEDFSIYARLSSDVANLELIFLWFSGNFISIIHEFQDSYWFL